MEKYRKITSVLSGLIALAVLSNFFIGLQRTTTLERKGSAREALAGPHLLIQREQNPAAVSSSTFPKSNGGKEQAIPVTKAPKPATMSSSPAFLRGVDPSKIEARRKKALFRLKMLQNYTRPDLEDLVDSEKNEIIGDVQFLLDFAVVGHGKCGTTTLMHWLADHPEIQCFREEIWELVSCQRTCLGIARPISLSLFHTFDSFLAFIFEDVFSASRTCQYALSGVATRPLQEGL